MFEVSTDAAGSGGGDVSTTGGVVVTGGGAVVIIVVVVVVTISAVVVTVVVVVVVVVVIVVDVEVALSDRFLTVGGSVVTTIAVITTPSPICSEVAAGRSENIAVDNMMTTAATTVNIMIPESAKIERIRALDSSDNAASFSLVLFRFRNSRIFAFFISKYSFVLMIVL